MLPLAPRLGGSTAVSSGVSALVSVNVCSSLSTVVTPPSPFLTSLTVHGVSPVSVLASSVAVNVAGSQLPIVSMYSLPEMSSDSEAVSAPVAVKVAEGFSSLAGPFMTISWAAEARAVPDALTRT